MFPPVQGPERHEFRVGLGQKGGLFQVAQAAAAIGITAFAVPAVRVVVLLHVLLEVARADGTEGFRLTEFRKEKTDEQHGRNAMHLPVTLAVSFRLLFQRQPATGAQERLEELTDVVSGEQGAHTQKVYSRKEIQESTTSSRQAQFVKDRMHTACPDDFVPHGVPLAENLQVSLDVAFIARVQSGPRQAVHPAEIMETVFGLVAEPRVERHGTGEIDFDLTELPPSTVEYGIGQAPVGCDPRPEFIQRTRERVDRRAPGQEMPPPCVECIVETS